MSVVHRPVMWGAQEWFPLNNGSGLVHGMQTAEAWISDMVDLQEANIGSLQMWAPAGASTFAQVIVSSTTSGCGLLFTANAPGASSVTVAISAPSGSTTTITASGNAITIAPALGSTNGAIMALFNKTTASCSLATADLYGAQSNGDPWSALQEDPMDACRLDLVITTSATALVGGGAANPTGELTIFVSNLPDLGSFIASSASVAVGGTGPCNPISLTSITSRYAYVQWVPSGTPSGSLYGAWMGKGTHA
jgi:hypothetical protein